MLDTIGVITTGGTIDKAYGSGLGVRDLHIGQPYAPTFLVGQTAGAVRIVTLSIMAKDSLDMTDDDRQHIVETIRSSPFDSFIVTHGTDTMLQTALAVARSGLAGLKTVVLTGALLPAVMKGSDADFQLGLALATCLSKESGVWIAMNGVFVYGSCLKDERTGQFVPILI